MDKGMTASTRCALGFRTGTVSQRRMFTSTLVEYFIPGLLIVFSGFHLNILNITEGRELLPGSSKAVLELSHCS